MDVSILIVLDDALVQRTFHAKGTQRAVSILIVLDDAIVLEKQRLY